MRHHRPSQLAVLVVALLPSSSAAAAAAPRSASGSGSGSSITDWGELTSSHPQYEQLSQLCRFHAEAEALRRFAVEFGHTIGNGTSAADAFYEACDAVCPSAVAPDLKKQCTDHSYHSFDSHFAEMQTSRPNLNWEVAFLVFSLIVGAGFKCFLPACVPYTVALLVLGIVLGAFARQLATQQDCPMYAILQDTDHDGVVSRAEYGLFICAGCAEGAFCMGETREHFKRTCGDGSARPNSCGWTFDMLNEPWSPSAFLAETKRDGRSEHLTADELWTARCNMLEDLISLSNMDPHLLLITFLPALLFEWAAAEPPTHEGLNSRHARPVLSARPSALHCVRCRSACFGLDIGIFRKQIVQICLMAFPAMITSSLITGGILYLLAPASWNFWVCWLIGVIASATDPVAVVALLKELGASKQLGTLIEGESLLNDGSAVVLFVWVRAAIGYSYSDEPPRWMDVRDRYTGQVGTNFVVVVAQMLLFGVVYGVAFGFTTKYMLKFVYNDKFIESSFVLGMSYLCFWMGELICGTSAVLAVVIMGLYINMNRSAISPNTLHFLHQFYEMIAHMLNTLIFSIAGSKLGLLFMDNALAEVRTSRHAPKPHAAGTQLPPRPHSSSCQPRPRSSRAAHGPPAAAHSARAARR